MTITAKYPGKCTICGGKINAGEKINWEKDKGASHVKCPEKVESVGPKKMIAKYEGKCKTCYCKIEVGDAIYYEKDRGAKHVDCVAAMEREQQRKIERKKHAPYEATRGSGYALYEPFVVGEVIEAPRHIQQEGIKYLVVVEAEEQYVSEDGYSFGVGAESGYVSVARCRAASDEEAAPLIEKKRQEEERKLARKKA